MIKDKKKLATILIALNLAFIWGNSMRTGTESQDMSEGLLEWFNFFLSLKEFGPAVAHHLLRKAAHLTEFACLSALIGWRRYLDTRKYEFAYPVLLGMAAGLVDETIQLFTPDRGPSLSDVWLDTSGAVLGMILLIWGHHLIKRKNTH